MSGTGKKEIKISLTDHKNPAGFLESCKRRYPDKKVDLSLEKDNLVVKIDNDVDFRMQIAISSFLNSQARYEMYAT